MDYMTTLTTVEALGILEWAILGGMKSTTLVAPLSDWKPRHLLLETAQNCPFSPVDRY